MKHLVAIVGPTGIGKSDLALKLAGEFRGEIVSADSRQLYCGLDIGTAKPTPEEQKHVRHHMIDIAPPDQCFSLTQYQEEACRAIDDIYSRGNLPLLTGGSGLYVWAILEGWQIPKVAPDVELRRQLEERAASGDEQKLYEELREADPEAAAHIDPRNIRRVIRALEIQKGGAVQKPARTAPYFAFLIIGLNTDRQTLYRRIDERVDAMINHGLVDETRSLMALGYGLDLPAMSGIGYRQIGEYLTGKTSINDAVQKTKTETHRLVRMQNNWFSRKDDRINWFDIQPDPYPDIHKLISGFLKEQRI
ncbi:MAG: tRNA (adenosine(37)-N6)-dimethylallyltransferase MiaA [Dehalococcoidia bacterium]|nr:tRNA (adenosine(37)-N6)-dimethylallyltransferase MiaA [Dehalococcoidia bacterium]